MTRSAKDKTRVSLLSRIRSSETRTGCTDYHHGPGQSQQGPDQDEPAIKDRVSWDKATQGYATIRNHVGWYETRMSLPLGLCRQRQDQDRSNGAANNDSKPHQCKAVTVRMEGSYSQAFTWQGLLTPEDRMFSKLIFKMFTGSSQNFFLIMYTGNKRTRRVGPCFCFLQDGRENNFNVVSRPIVAAVPQEV